MIPPISFLLQSRNPDSYSNLFEFYLRFYTGVFYDLATQALSQEKPDLSGAQKQVFKELRQRLEMAKVATQDFRWCMDQFNELAESLEKEFYPSLPEEVRWATITASRQADESSAARSAWFRSQPNGNETLKLPAGMDPLLGQWDKSHSLGSYVFFSCSLFIGLRKTQLPCEALRKHLRCCLYAILLTYRIRNDSAHFLETRIRSNTFKALLRWLQEKKDLAFELEENYEIMVPIDTDETESYALCIPAKSILNSFQDEPYRVPLKYLKRAGEAKMERSYLRKIYLCLDGGDWRKIQRDSPFLSEYLCLSPFIATNWTDFESRWTIPEERFGFLAYLNRSQSYCYISLDSFARQAHTGESMDWGNDFLERNQNASFHKLSNKPIQVTLGNHIWEKVGENRYISRSSHPEFIEAVERNNDTFVYYPVIRPEGVKVLENLLSENSQTFLVLLSGHGGLGKTHLVLSLIRERFKKLVKLQPEAKEPILPTSPIEPYPRRVIFLSAKQTRMNIMLRQKESLKDYDFGDYPSLVEKLIDLLDQDYDWGDTLEEKTMILVDVIQSQEEPLLLILDDLDSLSMTDQEQIASLLCQIQGKNCRIIVTARLITNRILVAMGNASSIQLEPLEPEQSEGFIVKYIQIRTKDPSSSVFERVPDYSQKKLQDISGGIPLNLALIGELLWQGKNANLWSIAEDHRKNILDFIFQNILENFDEETQLVMGTLCAYLRTVFEEDSKDSYVGFLFLRLLVPQLAKGIIMDAITQLESYAILYKGQDISLEDNPSLKLRSEAFSRLPRVKALEAGLDPMQKALLEEIKGHRLEYNRSMGILSYQLDLLLQTVRRWSVGVGEEPEWALTIAGRVLELGNNVSSSNREVWLDLTPLANLDFSISSLNQAEGSNAKNLALKVLEEIKECRSIWPASREPIRQGFEAIAQLLEKWEYLPARGEDFSYLLRNSYNEYTEFYNEYMEFFDITQEVICEKLEYLAEKYNLDP